MRIEHPTDKANFSIVSTDRFRVAFSYETPIAYSSYEVTSSPGWTWVVRENDWGPTTGKHLNELDGGNKSRRLPSDEFEAALARVETS